MKRFALEKLKEWKKKANRKPLIIRGARQVGKTWLMKEFGRTCFEKVAYVNFDSNTRMQQVFDGEINIERIILAISAETGISIDVKDTLLIFDEVQEVPKALSSLKYFCENAPEYAIVAAGSLLGVALHKGTSFPVGKVDFMDLYPLTFQEFLCALGEERFVNILQGTDTDMVRKGSRAKDFELAIQWLLDCGLIHKVQRAGKAALPLKAYLDLDVFKIYLLDVGLLMAMTDMDAQVIIDGNRIFTEFKGALTEQYVLQQLIALDHIEPYYYSTANSSGEIDFLLQGRTSIIPLEVKAEENLRAKSLKAFCEKYKPKYAVRMSMSDYRKQEWMTNIPLYNIDRIKEYLEQ